MNKIKRPVAAVGFTFFITGTVVLSMPREYVFILLALFALFTIFHRFTKNSHTKFLALVFATAITAVIYTTLYSAIFENNIERITTEKQICTGYVNAVTNSEGTGYCVTLLDDKLKEKYSVSVYYGEGFDIGDVVEITGNFSENKKDKYIFSNYSKDILGRFAVDKMELSDVKVKTVKYKALTLRKQLIKNANEIYKSDSFPLVASMGFNDKHYLSSDMKNLFKTAGISHALVVSGFHVGVVVLMMQLIMRLFPVDKRIKNVITAVLVVIFMYIIGFTPSVIRAGTLAAVILLTSNFRIEQDSLTTLAVIGLFCILQNPFITRDIGAMLSYSAAVGMIAANDWCIKRYIKNMRRNFICALTAVTFTMPVLALAGMSVTLLSPLFNIVFALPVSAICSLSVITPILHFIPLLDGVNSLLVYANTCVISFLTTLLEFVDKYLSAAYVNLSQPIVLVVIVVAIVAAVVVYIQTNNKIIRRIFVIVVSIITFLCYNLLNYNVVTVTAFDSGREASFHITSKGKEYLVLSEEISQNKAEDYLVSVNGSKYESVYCCFNEFKVYTDYDDISKQFVEINRTGYCDNGVFSIESQVSGNGKLFTIHISQCDIQFAHGKVETSGAEYYFLGNDKPKSVQADEIYIFGNVPYWMNVDNIIPIDSDLKIKINLKTGKYKTVKDVFNFGYQL